MFRKSVLPLIGVILLMAGVCQSGPVPVILVSKDYDNRFVQWLPMAGRPCLTVNMYAVGADSITYYLSRADGIIISGGPDVNPAWYGKASETQRCESIDNRRDSLEIMMTRYAMEQGIPLLGICRGQQILNVANNGSLIIDIPADHDTIIKHRGGEGHMVRIVEGTLLSELILPDSGFVNSSHHQAVEHLAPGFRASAYAPDGIIEAIEPVDLKGHPFILGVQWHPETLARASENHPFSRPILLRFMEEAYALKR
jgi:gamma-glutamyl-gamma-aminobutyrate hydrolase PuuD